MTSEEYEHHVAAVLRAEGWTAAVTPYARDGGVDIVAQRDGIRVAVQAKMYGASRRVNASQVRELYGAAEVFDCTSAMLATDGELLDDAHEIAVKLNVAVRHIPRPVTRRGSKPEAVDSPSLHVASCASTFGQIWREHVVPLAGRTLYTDSQRLRNDILKVDDGGLTRRTSSGRTQHIKIEIFEWAINRLLRGETVLRDEINQQYTGRASSGVLAVLSEVPVFESVTSGKRSGVRRRATR